MGRWLNAHWLTYFLGGYAFGAAWTALVITAAATLRRETGPDADPAATSATTVGTATDTDLSAPSSADL